MCSDVKLYRKRYIPNEKKPLDGDVIHHFDENIVITSWDSFRPRKDLAHGLSVYYRKEGYKISRIYGEDDSFSRWYCDIICEDVQGNEITFCDLLIDVVIFPDGSVRIVDLDEAADAADQGLISSEQLNYALRAADNLLRTIYSGRFEELTSCLLPYYRENKHKAI